MLLSEAYAELGIAEGVSPDEARRAYLRLLKQRNPETDPEGFRRLREAYELLRATAPPRREALVVAAASPSSNAAPPLSSPAPSPRAHVEEPSRLSPAPPAVTVAVPPSPTPAPPDPAVRVRTLLAQQRFEEAASALADLYDAQEGEPNVVLHVRTPVVLDLILRLHEIGAPGAARRLQQAFARRLTATGDELRLLGAHGPAWSIVRELGDVGDELSQPVRSIMASFARTRDWHAAAKKLSERRGWVGVPARDARLLRRSGGALSARVANELSYRFVAHPIRLLALIASLSSLIGYVTRHSDVPAWRQTPDLREAINQAEHLAREANAQNQPVIAAAAARLERALLNRDCDAALQHSAELRYGPCPAALESRLGATSSAVESVCAATVKPSP